MNAQQARIYALLDEAADQFEADNVVDLVIQTELAEAGYPVCQLDRDLPLILSRR